MSWRERLGPARFRDVPFFVETAERSGGRRTVLHEYPLRDEPFVEDMGRSARDFRVEGYVLGSDYQAARDALIGALEQAGPGELLHPYHGTKRVICTRFGVSESSAEGGIARFSIEFTQTEAAAAFPSATPAGGALVKASVDRAARAVSAEFLAKYKPGSILDSVSNALREMTLRMDNLSARIDATVQQKAMFQARIARLLASGAALVNKPADLLAEVLGLFGGLSGDAPQQLYGFDPGPRPPTTTSSRRLERANFDAFGDLVRRCAVIRASELAPDAPFGSHDAARAAREAITDLIDLELETASDDTFPALSQLRADLVSAVPGSTALARLLDHTPRQTVPSLVLAHQLYGDVPMEADLVTRNRVAHPGFVLGGKALEVLSRG